MKRIEKSSFLRKTSPQSSLQEFKKILRGTDGFFMRPSCLFFQKGILWTFVWGFGLPLGANPQWPAVIGVPKKVKLHRSEKVDSDYFVRGGLEKGLVKGVLISVVRRIPVHDVLEDRPLGSFYVKVADVEIIQVEDNKSVARLVASAHPETSSLVDYNSVMMGDFLDLRTLRLKEPPPSPQSPPTGESSSREPSSGEFPSMGPPSVEPPSGPWDPMDPEGDPAFHRL